MRFDFAALLQIYNNSPSAGQHLKATTFSLLPMHYSKQALQRKVLARHCAEPTKIRPPELWLASTHSWNNWHFPLGGLLTHGAVLRVLSGNAVNSLLVGSYASQGGCSWRLSDLPTATVKPSSLASSAAMLAAQPAY